jgi:hypothetical protein
MDFGGEFEGFNGQGFTQLLAQIVSNWPGKQHMKERYGNSPAYLHYSL